MTAPQTRTQSPYQSYVYAYPHKTSYRRIEPPIPLRDLWAAEDRSALFLYLHIPFCEMRCGFCNLFTTAHPDDALTTAYLDALDMQAHRVRAALDAAGGARFALGAIGGGTPTYLDAAELHRLFDIAQNVMGADLDAMPISVETSPATATPDRLRALRQRGVTRISIGVQSFIEAEARAAGRPQRTSEVERALDALRAVDFDTLNIDLIYGLPGQTVASWLKSLRTTLRWLPEELYLYPLYVRPLTGLDRRDQAQSDAEWDAAWDQQRLACYRAGRDFLLAHGYQQVSMRLFRAENAPTGESITYRCQEDGMVGLGCGARSYTRGCHYSSDFAVGRAGIRAILNDYIRRPAGAFDVASYGVRLDNDEQRRRYVIKSVLHATGLDRARYRAVFGREALADFPVLRDFIARGWLAQQGDGILHLTADGLEWSDALGPALYSPAVRALMEGFELR